MPTTTTTECELCRADGGRVLWRDALLRIVAVDAPDYPGFCRVIVNRHAAEMTDLPVAERDAVMRAVFAVEAALRDAMRPDKINLASLGNMVPHVHWHVIPRFRDDRHFPAAIWAAAARAGSPSRRCDIDALAAEIARRLGAQS